MRAGRYLARDRALVLRPGAAAAGLMSLFVHVRLLGAEFFIAMYAGGLEKFGYRSSPLEKIA